METSNYENKIGIFSIEISQNNAKHGPHKEIQMHNPSNGYKISEKY
jgi:hypothetical protein